MFDEMVAMGLEPSMATRAALLNAYAESRQPQQAVEVLLSMRRQGITPSVQVSASGGLDARCNIIASGCPACRRLASAAQHACTPTTGIRRAHQGVCT